MRFKNLTINLTLTCLSIVAFTGLVLLPISDIICDDGDDWNVYDNGYSANYYASQNEDNRSWYLQGDVQAKGVRASGSVSILNKDRYSANWKKMGNASVSVSRANYTWYHRYASGFFVCNNWAHDPDGGKWYKTCQGHTKEGDADSNVEGKPGFKPGKHTDITLDVKVREANYKLLYGWSKKKKTTVSGEVGAGYVFVEGKSKFQHESETIVATSISKEMPRNEVVNEAETSSWSVSVEFDAKADSSASASVSFDGSSSSKSLDYKAP